MTPNKIIELQLNVIADGLRKSFTEGKMEANTSKFLRELEEAQAKDTWQGDVDELRGK